MKRGLWGLGFVLVIVAVTLLTYFATQEAGKQAVEDNRPEQECYVYESSLEDYYIKVQIGCVENFQTGYDELSTQHESVSEYHGKISHWWNGPLNLSIVLVQWEETSQGEVTSSGFELYINDTMIYSSNWFDE